MGCIYHLESFDDCIWFTRSSRKCPGPDEGGPEDVGPQLGEASRTSAKSLIKSHPGCRYSNAGLVGCVTLLDAEIDSDIL